MLWLFAISLFSSSSIHRPPFSLEYSNPTNTISVLNSTITLTEFLETYDNPMSSIPSGRTQVVKTATLSSAQLQALKSKLSTSGFWKLSKNFYGAGENERAYLFTIEVMNGKNKKTVVYKSNPAPETEKKPQAFDAVEKHILDLVKSIPDWK
jgi:hypothetical protein